MTMSNDKFSVPLELTEAQRFAIAFMAGVPIVSQSVLSADGKSYVAKLTTAKPCAVHWDGTQFVVFTK
jgi:hypothetical protein